ncbi:MAG: GNAT family N-acetyltransferase [Ahniella sp.]|nr:GNAT family N-acetyltransferase [Ahniella sp.]
MSELRLIVESDFDSILGLNDAEVQQTSPMDVTRLRSLVAMSCHAKVVTVGEQIAGFLIALRDGAPYVNDNFRWFASRFAHFLYVDRIVVGSAFSGRGIGSILYDDLFAFARTQGLDTITCEYNLVPPNPSSRAFHDRFGFTEIGTQWVSGGTKKVSLQAVAAGTARKRSESP